MAKCFIIYKYICIYLLSNISRFNSFYLVLNYLFTLNFYQLKLLKYIYANKKKL